MGDSQIVAFLVAAALLTVAPGPDNFLVIRNVLHGGSRNGMVTAFGISAGLFVHATLSALGVSVLLMHSATAFQVAKLIGACYLGWLGIQSLRRATSAVPPVESIELDELVSRRSSRRCLTEGFLSNVLNPKTAVFYLAFLPQFIGPTEPVFAKSMMLAGLHYTEALVWFVFLSLMIDYARQLFLTPAFSRWMDGLCGTMLIGFGVSLAFARK